MFHVTPKQKSISIGEIPLCGATKEMHHPCSASATKTARQEKMENPCSASAALTFTSTTCERRALQIC